jgi:DNA-binding HxlR family transcriptional regulator
MSTDGLETIHRRPAPSAGEHLARSGGPADVRLTVVLRGSAGPYAAAVPRLLGDERTRTIVRALADGPRRPSELECLPGIARSTLYARLSKLTTLGVVATHRVTEFPLRVEYRLNETGRAFLANELLIERQERRRLARTDPGAEAALGNLLRLLAPVSHPATDREGRCVLVEHEPSGWTHAVRLLVEDRQVTVSECASAVAPHVHVRAASKAWDDALVAGRANGLQIAGDLILAHAVMAAFGSALGV